MSITTGMSARIVKVTVSVSGFASIEATSKLLDKDKLIGLKAAEAETYLKELPAVKNATVICFHSSCAAYRA